jgi:hypothetical protein
MLGPQPQKAGGQDGGNFRKLIVATRCFYRVCFEGRVPFVFSHVRLSSGGGHASAPITYRRHGRSVGQLAPVPGFADMPFAV